MAELRLTAKPAKCKMRPTSSAPGFACYPNLVLGLVVSRPDQARAVNTTKLWL
jgi:hypothetical protein